MSLWERGWLDRFARVLAVVVVGWIGLYACGIAVDSDERDHVLGRSTTATVDLLAAEPESDCGTRKKEQYVLTYRVVGETDVRTARTCRKRPPALGRREVWLTGDEIHFASPVATRAWVVAVPIGVAALIATFGRGVSSRSRRR